MSGPREFDGTERFTVLRRLGAGGMGVVYEVHDDERDVRVALKLLPLGNPLGLVRFKREFRALTSIVHPNLVALYELVADENQWFFTMEVVEGVDFLEWVRPDGLDVDRLRDALRQLAHGVGAIHAAGRLHRDLKPSNVMVRPSGRVVILDFGLVTDVGVSTTGSQVGGTAAYMAPEQWQGEVATSAGDWYAIGVMLFEALTGTLPFNGRKSEILIAKLGGEAPLASSMAPDVPPVLDALCAHLLKRDPAERATDADLFHALGAPVERAMGATAMYPIPDRDGGSPVIGRERHLGAMTAAFATVEQGGTALLHVHGQSGAGKSTLLDRFLGDLRQRDDVVVLAGRSFEQESVPYKAVDTVIDALAAHMVMLPESEAEALVPPNIAVLARLFPVLQRVPAIAAAQAAVTIPDQRELRRIAFAALRELLDRMGRHHRLVVVIDDLQWGDVDSALLLGELLQPPAPPPLLLVLSYRSEDRERSACLRTIAEVERSMQLGDRRVEVGVGPLTLVDAERLALTLLDTSDPRAHVQARQVAVESQGNPYFVTELVRHLSEGGGWSSGDSGARRVDLEEVLWHRVVRLPEDPRTVLEVVAVAGKPLRAQVASDTLDAHEHLQHSIGVLRNGHLLRSSGPRMTDDLETYHDRVRESVVAHLSTNLVRHYHTVLAEALEETGEADAETIAVHLDGAGQGERAGRFYEQAARESTASLAFDRAAKLFRLALDRHAGKVEQKRALQCELGEALANAGRGFDSAEAYLAASAGSTGDDLLTLEGLAATQYCISGHPDQGRTIFRRTLARIGLPLPDSPVRIIATLLWRRAWLRIRGVGFTERPEENVDPAVLRKIDLLWSVSTGLSLPDALGIASMQTKGLLLALEAGEPYRLARALAFEAFLVSSAGWPTEKRTAELFQRAEALAARIDHPHALGMVQLAAGLIALDQTRFADAMEHCEAAEEIFRTRCTGVWWETATARSVIAWTFWHRGHTDALRQRATAYIAEARDRGDMFTVTNLGAVALPHLSLIADDPDAAMREVDEAIAAWGVDGFHLQHVAAMLSRAHIHLYRGDGAAALAHIDSLWPALRRALQLRTQIVRIMMVDLRARCVLAAGVEAADPRPFAKRARKYARELEREDTAMSRPFAVTLLAGVAALEGNAGDAATHLRSAQEHYAVFDDRLRSASVEMLLGRYTGGAEGEAHQAAAAAAFAGERVKRPEGIVALYAPGHRG